MTWSIILVVLCGLISLGLGDECGPMERLKVQQQWEQAYGQGVQRTELGKAIWKALFAQAPEARKLFVRVRGDDINSPEFEAHISRILGGIDIVMSLLADDATLNNHLHHLAQQHKSRSIPSNYFDVMGHALMEVIPAQLGRCFDDHAWEVCYKVIADGIRHAD